ncbi:MAG: GxxExxY protein [Muribaculaceae bacterium]|nr:GxxExxY protein [Muribaculaceae bacterium]
MDIELLVKQVMDCAMIVRRKLTPGYLEKVYENALTIELRKAGLLAQQQQPLEVKYDDQVVGFYVPDIIVENCLILEIKAVEHLQEANEAQLVNYLTTTGIEDGLLINFGNLSKIQIKRKYRTCRQTN